MFAFLWYCISLIKSYNYLVMKFIFFKNKIGEGRIEPATQNDRNSRCLFQDDCG